MVEPSEELQVVFDKAIKDAKRLEHEYVTLEHLLFAMLCTENFTNILKGFGIDVQPLQNDILTYLQTKLDDIKVPAGTKYKPKKTQTVERVMNRAFTQVLFSGRHNIDITDVFLSLMSEKKSWANYHL